MEILRPSAESTSSTTACAEAGGPAAAATTGCQGCRASPSAASSTSAAATTGCQDGRASPSATSSTTAGAEAGGRTSACGRCFKARGTGAAADELPARKDRGGGQRSAGL